MMRRVLLCCAILLLGAAPRARAQTPPLDAARAQLENIKPDSAFALLAGYTPPHGTATETRYWTLLGLTQLLRGHQDEAQRAFRSALDTDAGLTIDSLTYIQSDAARVFAAAKADLRRALGPPLPVAVALPADTVMPPYQGRLPIELRPHLRSRVIVTIAPERDRLDYVFADTEDVAAVATPAWNLQQNGEVVPAGRYVLRVTAIDVLRRLAPPVERLVVISRTPVDTIAPPADPDAGRRTVALMSAPAPSAGPSGTTRLLVGAALGLGAVGLTSVAGNHSINSGFADRSRFVVAGVVSAAALIGWLSGRHHAEVQATLPPSEDPDRAEALRQIALENARRRSMAPVRIQTGSR